MPTKKNRTEKATFEPEVPLEKGINMASPKAAEAAERLAAQSAASSIYGDDPENCKQVKIKDNSPNPTRSIYAGKVLELEAVAADGRPQDYYFNWNIKTGDAVFVAGVYDPTPVDSDGKQFVYVATRNVKPDQTQLVVELTARRVNSRENSLPFHCVIDFEVRQADLADLKTNLDEKLDKINQTIQNSRNLNNTVPVSLQRTTIQQTQDLGLWVVIRKTTQALNFNKYYNFINLVLCSTGKNGAYDYLQKIRALPFNDTDAYRLLKVATEAFLLTNGGVITPVLDDITFDAADLDDLNARISGNVIDLIGSWKKYLRSINGDDDPMLPYLALVNRKFGNETLRDQFIASQLPPDYSAEIADECLHALRNKLTEPFMVELIWSYWHEEGMLVQTMNAISRRFQNIRGGNGGRDPLANLEIDPLRPLNNLLWGYVQDEQHRLSLVRRVYEYDHQYGIALQGKAVPKLRPADSRSKFLEAFHHLLHLCSVFYRQDDDTTVNSDGFPILNALREVHLILSHGAHNQFGDLPSTARQEMLIQQWLLARPEFREFLPTRSMVAYPEPWMDRVDAMKTLQGWTDISIDHFSRLAVFGEQILLSIRFGAWSDIGQSSPSAANWARFWRAEIQGYLHDYRAVTGVDLASSARVDSTPPSVHLFKRYLEQARR